MCDQYLEVRIFIQYLLYAAVVASPLRFDVAAIVYINVA
jgi:hypothetical protein